MNDLIAEPLSQVRSERLTWLWERWLPRGKLTLLDGDPGIGKSLLTLDLAARLTRGIALPGGAPSEPRSVLLLAAEDDAADTTRPRAEAAGADLDRLIVLSGPAIRSLQFPESLPKLAEVIDRHRPELLIIDPIVAFLSPKIGANADQSIRRVLSQLAAIGEAADCTILMVRHLRKAGSKNALYRGSGSIGFIASARTAWLAARHPDHPEFAVLAVSKCNLADPPASLGYRVKPDANGLPVIDWLEPLDISANALGIIPTETLRPREKAIEWLRQQLANGPRKVSEIMALAASGAIPERTLLRAKSELRVQSKRVDLKPTGHEWWWYDPAAAWPENAPFRKPYELPPLPDLEDFLEPLPTRPKPKKKGDDATHVNGA
jgi:putative DNA primase/helicase